MDRRRQHAAYVLLGLAVSLGAAWLVQKRQPREKGWMRTWQRLLSEKHGAARAAQLAEDIRRNNRSLLLACNSPANRTLRWHLEEFILPGLALYQALLGEYHGERLAALAEVDDLFRAWTVERFRLKAAALRIMPFRVFKIAAVKQMNAYPVEGWDIAYATHTAGRYAFNITRCYYLNTLTVLGAPELTACFCKTDDVMAELFPAWIRFERPHTLGRGDALCDFAYCKHPSRIDDEQKNRCRND